MRRDGFSEFVVKRRKLELFEIVQLHRKDRRLFRRRPATGSRRESAARRSCFRLQSYRRCRATNPGTNRPSESSIVSPGGLTAFKRDSVDRALVVERTPRRRAAPGARPGTSVARSLARASRLRSTSPSVTSTGGPAHRDALIRTQLDGRANFNGRLHARGAAVALLEQPQASAGRPGRDRAREPPWRTPRARRPRRLES